MPPKFARDGVTELVDPRNLPGNPYVRFWLRNSDQHRDIAPKYRKFAKDFRLRVPG